MDNNVKNSFSTGYNASTAGAVAPKSVKDDSIFFGINQIKSKQQNDESTLALIKKTWVEIKDAILQICGLEHKTTNYKIIDEFVQAIYTSKTLVSWEGNSSYKAIDTYRDVVDALQSCKKYISNTAKLQKSIDKMIDAVCSLAASNIESRLKAIENKIQESIPRQVADGKTKASNYQELFRELQDVQSILDDDTWSPSSSRSGEGTVDNHFADKLRLRLGGCFVILNLLNQSEANPSESISDNNNLKIKLKKDEPRFNDGDKYINNNVQVGLRPYFNKLNNGDVNYDTTALALSIAANQGSMNIEAWLRAVLMKPEFRGDVSDLKSMYVPKHSTASEFTVEQANGNIKVIQVLNCTAGSEENNNLVNWSITSSMEFSKEKLENVLKELDTITCDQAWERLKPEWAVQANTFTFDTWDKLQQHIDKVSDN